MNVPFPPSLSLSSSSLKEFIRTNTPPKPSNIEIKRIGSNISIFWIMPIQFERLFLHLYELLIIGRKKSLNYFIKIKVSVFR